MTKQVAWNKYIVDTFVELACLSEEEEMILRTRAKGWTITQQSMEFHMSKSKVDKIIARLKKKYDAIQQYDVLLPPRKSSVEETYMDTH